LAVPFLEESMKRFTLGIAFVTALAACGGDAESRESLEDKALNDSARAQAQQSRSAPAAPVRAIPSGTLLTFEVRETVSTTSHQAGSTFALVLVDAVSGTAGALLPAGSSARGLVTVAHSSTGPEDESILGLRVTSVEAGGSQRTIAGTAESTHIESSSRDSGTRTAGTILTGAAAGAIIGQILGQDTRSTVTGAAVGTAVGVVVALTTRGGHAELPVGSRITVRLSQDLTY
jgi:predicted extracellular nuclease